MWTPLLSVILLFLLISSFQTVLREQLYSHRTRWPLFPICSNPKRQISKKYITAFNSSKARCYKRLRYLQLKQWIYEIIQGAIFSANLLLTIFKEAPNQTKQTASHHTSQRGRENKAIILEDLIESFHSLFQTFTKGNTLLKAILLDLPHTFVLEQQEMNNSSEWFTSSIFLPLFVLS